MRLCVLSSSFLFFFSSPHLCYCVVMNVYGCLGMVQSKPPRPAPLPAAVDVLVPFLKSPLKRNLAFASPIIPASASSVVCGCCVLDFYFLFCFLFFLVVL